MRKSGVEMGTLDPFEMGFSKCSLADLNQVRAAPQSRYAEGKDPTAMLRRKPSACHDWHAV